MEKRIFLAVNLPEKMREGIHSGLCEKAGRPGLKTVEKNNLHVTIKFLGYLGEEKLDEVIEKLSGLGKLRKFTAETGEAGHFGGRVLWLGIGKGNENFIRIAAEIDRLLGLAGKRLHPHITIARNKTLARNEAVAIVEGLRKENYVSGFEVKSVELMESRLSPKGPEYLVIRKFELG